MFQQENIREHINRYGCFFSFLLILVGGSIYIIYRPMWYRGQVYVRLSQHSLATKCEMCLRFAYTLHQIAEHPLYIRDCGGVGYHLCLHHPYIFAYTSSNEDCSLSQDGCIETKENRSIILMFGNKTLILPTV